MQEELGIPTIYQHLYHHGRELDEHSATIGALGILANDVLDLREDSEDIDLLGSGSDHEARRAGEGGSAFSMIVEYSQLEIGGEDGATGFG